MREITVRGRHSVTGEWFYGYLLAPNVIGFVEVIDDKDGRGANPQIVEFCLVDPESVGQYTGLKDRNGVEIYEGDIVVPEKKHRTNGKLYGWYSIKTRMKAVDWRTGYHSNGWNVTAGAGDNTRYHIIGNIYDNPELLK